MPPNGTTSLIILQPTPFCNVDCSYCYLPQRDDRTRLAIEQIDQIFAKLFEFPTISNQVTVVWHAGEPLVLRPEYYEAAFARIRTCCPRTLKIDHALQTNGILINDEWCDLFQRWDVRVGVSIDGPKYINDAARKTRSGGGTYDRVVAGIKCLQRRQIPFYVISVLTKAGILDPDAMFSFYHDFNIRDLGFNIEEVEGIHKTSSLSSDFDEQALVRFFFRFSALMKERQFPIAIRELEETLASIRFFQKQGPINNLVIPFGIITIGIDGEVYTFSPELAGYSSDGFPTFSIGNIFNHTFAELECSAVLKAMAAQINEGIELCRAQCKYFSICGGGAPSNKLFENGTFASTETLHCRLTRKRVTDFLLATIESMHASGV
jgi:uncharacterized protein